MSASASSQSGKDTGGSSLLAKLQDQISQGKHTDMVIRVRVQPALSLKRPKTAKTGGGGGGGGGGDILDVYTDIGALSAILCVRSEYFERALSGPWIEAAERRVELVVQTEQELEDFKLLLKLSCSDDYTHDAGVLLSFATRVRLAALADAFMFKEAVDQIVASLPVEIGFKEALDCCTEGALPPALEKHPDLPRVRTHLVAPLAEGLEAMQASDAVDQAIVTAGVEALAACLGPISGMIRQIEEDYVVTASPSLRQDVKDLSPYALLQLLKSNALQLSSENDTYTLLTHWVWQSDNGDAEEFAKIARYLRYHHMTPDFLSLIVCSCTLMKASGLLPVVMSAALAQRHSASVSLVIGAEKSRGEPNRGVVSSKAAWKFSVSFTRKQVMSLKPGDRVRKWCSIVAGYPMMMWLDRGDDEENDAIGLYLFLHVSGEWVEELPGAPDLGVGINFTMTFPSIQLEKSLSVFFDAKNGCGFDNAFARSWSEVVRKDSPIFINDTLEIIVKVKYAGKK